jgi:gamma-glutamylcyclotransferase (GGCT)/AIG2-like uncharacterized protein YtfP
VVLTFLGWNATEWYAFGTNVLAFGAVTGGAWALYSHRKTRRVDAARWLQTVFTDFYTNRELIAGRELIEYDFDDRLGPLLLLRVTNREVVLSPAQREDLRRVDLVLNYFEQLLYLETERHILKRDRDVFFEYWFGIIGQPSRAGLRRYLARCGYERCTAELGLRYGEAEYVALYGSLMRQFDVQDKVDVRNDLEYVGPCQLKGALYSLGGWPALVPGDGRVEAELYRVRGVRAFTKMDPVEHFKPGQPEGCKYLRRCVRLLDEPAVDAWTYFYNWPLNDEPRIPHGSWARYVAERS